MVVIVEINLLSKEKLSKAGLMLVTQTETVNIVLKHFGHLQYCKR